jgi:signal peptidase complex subunit 3
VRLYPYCVDLRPVWNWNTAQLFVYVTVEWESEAMPMNRAVIWDRIIRKEEEALIQEIVDTKYHLNDQHASLRGKNLKISLNFDVMPIVGLLKISQSHCLQSFRMPDKYLY